MSCVPYPVSDDWYRPRSYGWSASKNAKIPLNDAKGAEKFDVQVIPSFHPSIHPSTYSTTEQSFSSCSKPDQTLLLKRYLHDHISPQITLNITVKNSNPVKRKSINDKKNQGEAKGSNEEDDDDDEDEQAEDDNQPKSSKAKKQKTTITSKAAVSKKKPEAGGGHKDGAGAGKKESVKKDEKKKGKAVGKKSDL